MVICIYLNHVLNNIMVCQENNCVFVVLHIPEFQHVSSVGNQKRVFGV